MASWLSQDQPENPAADQKYCTRQAGRPPAVFIVTLLEFVNDAESRTRLLANASQREGRGTVPLFKKTQPPRGGHLPPPAPGKPDKGGTL